MAKLKKMCKTDAGDFKKLKKKLFRQVAAPRFICTKCLRVAADEHLLCKPEPIDLKLAASDKND